MKLLLTLTVVVLGAVAYAIVVYNGLVNKKNKVANSWSQIDVQLKRRFDLIPNLLETVKGYAAHEKQTLESVMEARTRYMSAGSHQDMIKASGELSQGLNRIFALSEAYPDLKSNVNFQELQRELSKTEDKIMFARQFYNDVVMEYNNAVQMFPGSIFARRFYFVEEPFFNIDEGEAANPQVKF